MTYTYKTRGTCSTQIDRELEGNIVHNVNFRRLHGNLQAIPKLVEGLTVEQVEEKSAASPATDARLPAAISWLRPVAKPTGIQAGVRKHL